MDYVASQKTMLYKLARPDGWDWEGSRLPGAINYRENIGKRVRRNISFPPPCDKLYTKLTGLSPFLYASPTPNHGLAGSEIPCSVYLVEVPSKSQDCFKQFQILKEVNPAKIFRWRYEEAINPVHPFKIEPPETITEKHLELLNQWIDLNSDIYFQSRIEDAVERLSFGVSFLYGVHRATNYVFGAVENSLWANGLAPYEFGQEIKNSIKNEIRSSSRSSLWGLIKSLRYEDIHSAIEFSTKDVILAYTGYIFAPAIKELTRLKTSPTSKRTQPVYSHWKDKYPFQPVVDLWKMGLVPSCDGRRWRLHGGQPVRVLWTGQKIKWNKL